MTAADEWAEEARNPMFDPCEPEKSAAHKEGTEMDFKTGDKIEHRLMPGFTMTVEDTRECETDANRPEPHLALKVTDPDGNEDWLCSHDVQRPGEGLPWT